MKRILIVFTTILSISSFAQFDIEASDFGTAGDTIIYNLDSAFTDNTDLKNTIGDSVIWDFSTLGSLLDDTVFFLNPSDLSGGSNFLNTDFGYSQNGLAIFMNVETNQARTKGISAVLSDFIDSSFVDSSILANLPENLNFKYQDDGLFYLDLPAEMNDTESGTIEGYASFFYGDTFSFDTTAGLYVDSIRVLEEVTFDSEIDGFGTAIMPDDEYYVIRQKVTYDRTYTVGGCTILPFLGCVWIDILELPVGLNQTEYRWFGEGQKFPIADIIEDSSGTISILRFQGDPAGLTVEEVDSISNLSIRNDLNSVFSLEKNGNEFIISLSTQKRFDISVFNIVGEEVYSEGDIKGKTKFSLNDKGIYLMTLQDENQNIQTIKITN